MVNRRVVYASLLLVTLVLLVPIIQAFTYNQQSQNITQTILRKWLVGWDKRVKISVDPDDVSVTLSDFPILVYISNSSGRNSTDVTFIFDELQSNANRKRIAFTTSDKVTQCYIEIEKWDTDNEQAWLW